MCDDRIQPLQEEIRRRMRGGASVDEVDREVIQSSGLGADAQAALWLYAWSFVPRRAQRREARELATLAG